MTVIAALLLAGVARNAWSAPPDDGAHAEASRLFTEGKSLFAMAAYPAACQALEKSHALEPAVGAVGLLAACHEKLGMLATAYREYVETAERARAANDDRGDFAELRAAALRERLPKVVVHANGDERDFDLSGNGVRLRMGEENVVDPGPLRLVAEAPGRRTWETVIVLQTSERFEITIPTLAEIERPISKSAAAMAPRGTGARADRPREIRSTGTAGWILAGVGLAGIAAGTIAGAVVLHENALIDDHCDANKRCDGQGLDAVNAARTVTWVNGLGWGIGAATTAVGVALIVTAKPRPLASVYAAPGRVTFVGRF
jgi:hypothetical protein